MDHNGDAHWEYDMNTVQSRDSVLDLLDGGHHTDDHNPGQHRMFRYKTDLQCKTMLRDFAIKDYKRPEISKMRLSKLQAGQRV